MTKKEMLTLLLKDGDKQKRKNDAPMVCKQIWTESWNSRAPMIAQDMPDYWKFCVNYPANCELCREYIPDDRSGLFCLRWEKTFPSKVKWYEKAEIQIKKTWRKNEKNNEIFKAKTTQF